MATASHWDALELCRGAIYLTGPTAVGKSEVGLGLAQRLHAEIVALDSMTLYRGLDIGTAKPTPEQRAVVRHHLIDVLDPWESASVAAYRDWALAVLAELAERGRTALFVGGTPLYLKALLRGLFVGPGPDAALRAELEAEALCHGDAALHARLAAVDPVTAGRLHPHDRRRIIRALEVYFQTGRPLSALQAEHDRPAAGFRVLALDRPRPELHRRIDRRVERMFAAGFVAEVERLRPVLGATARQAVGYAEVLDLLAGRCDRDQAIARIQARTRQFAKRQLTWFRGLAEVRTWPVPTDEPAERTAERLFEALR